MLAEATRNAKMLPSNVTQERTGKAARNRGDVGLIFKRRDTIQGGQFAWSNCPFLLSHIAPSPFSADVLRFTL